MYVSLCLITAKYKYTAASLKPTKTPRQPQLGRFLKHSDKRKQPESFCKRCLIPAEPISQFGIY